MEYLQDLEQNLDCLAFEQMANELSKDQRILIVNPILLNIFLVLLLLLFFKLIIL